MSADLILCNANVLTLDSNYPRARLIAIKNGKVLAVAKNEALEEFKGPETAIIDCRGKTILPGFNDAHCHLIALAKSMVSLDLSPSRVHSILDIQKEVARSARDLPPGSWINGEGYNEFYLAEKRHPKRWDLDKATSLHPVKLTHRSGHAHVLNSLALALVGISKETAEPPGGIIERDCESGEPNGLLYDMGGMLAKKVPPLADSELNRAIKLAGEKLLSLGITSVGDASLNTMSQWNLFQRWKSQGSLRCRLSLMLGEEGFQQSSPELVSGSGMTSGSEMRLGAVKIVLQETTGRLCPSWQELEQMVLKVHQSDPELVSGQVAIHAVEENTIEAACSVMERTLKRFPRAGHRHRIEHCSVCRPEMAKRLASLGVVVVTQPAFIYYSGERYLNTVAQEQLERLYPIGTLIKAGVKVAAGSDCPVVPPNPLVGIYAAVSRKAETGETILPEESISPLEALRMYTEGAAYASFEEGTKGNIIPGKLADLVILSGDPTEVPVEKMKDLEVEMTIIGGEVVYRKC